LEAQTIPNVRVDTYFDCLPYAMTVLPLVPYRDYSEAHLLHCWTGLEPVYAQSGRLYSFSLEVLDEHMHFW